MRVIRKGLVGVEPAGPEPSPTVIRGITRIAPSPFTVDTLIELNIEGQPGSGFQMEIIDPAGRLVRYLPLPGTGTRPARIRWGGRDDACNQLSSGIYLARVRTASQVATRKLILCK